MPPILKVIVVVVFAAFFALGVLQARDKDEGIASQVLGGLFACFVAAVGVPLLVIF
jgi:VIT1/CCC1 family predicted Fe2+/Mn2+ transporter